MDISKESDRKLQDKLPVLSSYGKKKFGCYVRERSLKKMSVVSVYQAAILSKVQLRMFV